MVPAAETVIVLAVTPPTCEIEVALLKAVMPELIDVMLSLVVVVRETLPVP